MKVGDLVRVVGFPEGCGGIILNVCEDIITTIDVFLHDGRIVYDQRVDVYMVMDEYH